MSLRGLCASPFEPLELVAHGSLSLITTIKQMSSYPVFNSKPSAEEEVELHPLESTGCIKCRAVRAGRRRICDSIFIVRIRDKRPLHPFGGVDQGDN